MEEMLVQLGADTISFFGGRGRGADRDVVGTGLLNAEGGELRTMLADDFFEARKRLYFVKQGRIALWKRQKLNCSTMTVSAETNASKGRWGGHCERVAVAEALATASVEGIKRESVPCDKGCDAADIVTSSG